MSHPDSYKSLSLPHLKLLHNPPSTPSPTSIITILLHRPSSRNAFTSQTASSLIKVLHLLSTDPRIKCIIISSSDPTNTIFCPGMDLSPPSPSSDTNSTHNFGPTLDQHRDDGGKLALAISSCTKPTISAINGHAVGVGLTLTLPTTIRIVSTTAKLGLVFSRRGFNMEACSSFYLPRLIGFSRALHLVTTGAVYPSTSPLFGDLFSDIVPPEEVLPTALKIATEIVENTSTVASYLMREMMLRGPKSPEEAHLLESKVFFDLFNGRDAKEGVDSFLEKRRPDFKGTMEEDAPRVYPWWEKVDVKAKI